VTNKRAAANSTSTRTFSSRELEALCPILKIMSSLDLIGLSSVRITRDDWGHTSYIITVYERLRGQKDNVVDIGANI
jgi:hypothetical protein